AARQGRDRTIRTLRGTLKGPLDRFGAVALAELERMRRARRIRRRAAGAAPLQRHFRFAADARGRCPLRAPDPQPGEARGPQPAAAPSRHPCVHSAELDLIASELDTRAAAAVRFAAATGLRPA